MNLETPFWRQQVYDYVMAGCGLFVVLTIVAMFFYPGGTFTNTASKGYSFFENFFSELGMWNPHDVAPNRVGAVLFFIALILAGLGMGFFFIAFRRFFQGSAMDQYLSLAGTILGVLSALCFIGVAFTPADLLLAPHKELVVWAFRLFPAAVLCYTIAMFHTGYARLYTFELVAFFGLLVAYMLLLEFGPDIKTYSGMVIQAVGQKIIVYASIISVLIQSYGTRGNNQPLRPIEQIG